jgi:cell division protein FtsB
VAQQPWLALPAAGEWWEAIVGSRAEVRQRGGVIPSWVPLTAIILALSLLCVSATFRSRAAMNEAKLRFDTEAARLQQLRKDNQALQADIARLQSNPQAIAEAAHQIGLIRPNEKVVKLR